ncbi:carboxylating nicotinate-nucleotide diphosphorylase [Aestuariispira ectoiniformans]|uniref:carboxylating nicotinate-nucleotide diphosphorylase n=1 Tax=Aestuariispira ectoiniformans TaxID=2775080 RepID=UPI00223B3461|nr:carboxylating nicotinate-nucleotide diphosphorylase [Aestuariispira ectoiniformans]
MSELPMAKVLPLIRAAYAEDLGDAGDITTMSTIPEGTQATAHLRAREDGMVAGVPVALACLREVDSDLRVMLHAVDGDPIKAGESLLTVSGDARSILIAERVMLNFLGHLCGIATLTAAYTEAVKGTRAKICCTRKTTPGLRVLEKYAVRCGGGANHRFGLYDAVLIKDNHIAACGGIGQALDAAREAVGHMVKIEVELDRLEDIPEALAHQPDVIMLDNMMPEELAEGVAQIDGRALVEASGSVSMETVRTIAEAGVDMISIGRLTHSAPNFDLGLDFD